MPDETKLDQMTELVMGLRNLTSTVGDLKNNFTEIVGELKGSVKDLKSAVDSKYVTRDEFEAKFSPVRMIAFGLVGLLLTAMVIAIAGMVLHTGAPK